MRCPDRRTRLLAFIAPWADARPQYRGSFGHAALDLSWLTTEALQEIAGRIVSAWRSERRARQAALDRRAA